MIKVELIEGGAYRVTIDGRRIVAHPGTSIHKMAADLLRLRAMQSNPDTKFPSYTLAQLEKLCQDGTATEEVRREVARRKGVIYHPKAINGRYVAK